jgi:hypothetical protein
MLDNSGLLIVKVHLRDQQESCTHALSIDLEFGSTKLLIYTRQGNNGSDTIWKLILKSLHNKIE